ncbi:hypothetical protein KM043_007101 [Ampulex compressa]|nr:hypothetical protein KM043_007101 [Ampulex compressa]
MPKIMAEAFARGLVNKIMLEAFDILDTGAQDGRLQVVNREKESINVSAVDREQSRTKQLVESMADDLRDVQIGDAVTARPRAITMLEEEVKRAACNIGGASTICTANVTETHITQGQGDVHQILRPAVNKAQTESANLTGVQKEQEEEHEAMKVSTSVIHRMIEELEARVGRLSLRCTEDLPTVEKQTWEESEEKVIRTIEGVGDAYQQVPKGSFETECAGQPRNVEHLDLKTSSPLYSTSATKNARVPGAGIEQIARLPPRTVKIALPSSVNVPAANDVQEESISGEAKSRRKKRRDLVGRIRKFLRATFSRPCFIEHPKSVADVIDDREDQPQIWQP